MSSETLIWTAFLKIHGITGLNNRINRIELEAETKTNESDHEAPSYVIAERLEYFGNHIWSYLELRCIIALQSVFFCFKMLP